MKYVTPFTWAALFLGFAGLLGLWLTGCDGAIPIDPEVDPCSIDGVEECCLDSEPCDTLPAFRRGYDQGWEAATKLCEEERVVCPKPPKHKVHRHHPGCKHRRPPHIKPNFNVDSDDPLEGI